MRVMGKCAEPEVESPGEAVDRLFGENLPRMDFHTRDLLIALWPLGADTALQRAVEFGAGAMAGQRSGGRTRPSEGMRELGVERPQDCPDWLMDMPVTMALGIAERAEWLIRGFHRKAALPWAGNESPVWTLRRPKVRKVSR